MAKKPDLYAKVKAMSETKPAEPRMAGAPEIAAVTRQTIEHEAWEAAKPKPKPETPEAQASDLTSVGRQTVEAMKRDSLPKPALKDGTPTAYQRESVPTQTRAHVSTSGKRTFEVDVPYGSKVRRPRIEKPHQSVYAHKAVFKVLNQIALAEDTKPQDLYREGLRHVLKMRGYDFDKLDNGEV